jgi:hypothetical protein
MISSRVLGSLIWHCGLGLRRTSSKMRSQIFHHCVVLVAVLTFFFSVCYVAHMLHMHAERGTRKAGMQIRLSAWLPEIQSHVARHEGNIGIRNVHIDIHNVQQADLNPLCNAPGMHNHHGKLHGNHRRKIQDDTVLCKSYTDATDRKVLSNNNLLSRHLAKFARG